MLFSTKTEYGLRAVIWLAKHWGRSSSPLSEIARDETMSRGYLEKLAVLLKRAGIVTSEKGVKGGYTLSRSPSEILLNEVIEALEGDKRHPYRCPAVNPEAFCPRESECMTKQVWVKIAKTLNSEMSKVRLSDLIWK